MSTYLIVADRLAWSMGLARSLHALGEGDSSAQFVVVVPADPALRDDEAAARQTALETAERARVGLRLEGLTVVDALAGPALPRKALEQEMTQGARSYDGIVLGITRRNLTQQMEPDLAQQLERRHGVPVRVIHLNGAMTH